MTSIVELVLPARLGRDFRWLWGGAVVSNLADGLLLAAGPLLVASVTRSPFAVAAAAAVQRLPFLLFGVVAGAIIDRTDRRRLVVVSNLLRAVAILALAAAVATDAVGLATMYLAFFALGTAETFVDNASSTLVAATVPRESIGLANARSGGAAMLLNQLVGPPVGALAYGLAAASPFGAAGIGYLVAATLVARMRLPDGDGSDRSTGRRMGSDIVEGMRWLWGSPPVRMLAVVLTIFNVTFGAAYGVWVLYALEVLEIGEVGFGILMAVSAAGGVVGAGIFGRLESRFSHATLLRAGLVLETVTHVALALTRDPIVAGAVMFLFGMHAMTWGTLSRTIRQRVVPGALLGRVTSVYLMGGVGALAVGTLLGGMIAEAYGVLAPFWFAGIGAAATTVVVWRSIGTIADAGQIEVAR